MKETGVKIHVPPPSVNRDEITIAGDKEGVQLAIEKIKQIYAKMVCIKLNYNNCTIVVCLYKFSTILKAMF